MRLRREPESGASPSLPNWGSWIQHFQAPSSTGSTRIGSNDNKGSHLTKKALTTFTGSKTVGTSVNLYEELIAILNADNNTTWQTTLTSPIDDRSAISSDHGSIRRFDTTGYSA